MKSEWKEYELGDVCSRLSSGKGIKAELISSTDKYAVYGGNGIRGYTNEYNFDGDCAIIGRQGAYCGNVRYFSGKAYMTEHAVVVCANNEHNTRYLSYVLSSMKLGRLSGQSAQPGLSVKTLSIQKVILPSLETQRKIVSIISSLDDKIVLNTAINENLQEQAQAICEKWVSDHSHSIVLRPLAEIADINPDTYSPKERWNHVNYLDTSSITNGVISEIQSIRPNEEKLPSRARRKIKPNDIVYSTVRPNQLHFGIVSNPLSNMLASTGFAVIRSRYSYICSPFIYHFLTSSAFIEKMQQLAEQSTSTFPSVKPSDIGACLIPCTDEVEMSKISDLCNCIYEIKSTIYQENQHLATLRDTLLPKLMNGEIDVENVRI